jgi:outer membrane immunogenic protein
MKKLLLAGVAAMALAFGAQAADLGVPRGAVAGVVVAPVFSWTGFYVGGDIGYWTSSTTVLLPALAGTTTSPNPNGIKLGGHIGYRHQFSNSLVLGVEGDLSWLGGSNREATLPGFAPNVFRLRATWDGSIRGTAGFAIDRALIYATGGVAFIQTNGCGANPPGTACVAGTQFGSTRTGWTVGAGLAYAVTPNVAIRGEYLYANYGTLNYVTPVSAGGITSYKLDTHTIRLGASYMFTTGPSAVVARY